MAQNSLSFTILKYFNTYFKGYNLHGLKLSVSSQAPTSGPLSLLLPLLSMLFPLGSISTFRDPQRQWPEAQGEKGGRQRGAGMWKKGRDRPSGRGRVVLMKTQEERNKDRQQQRHRKGRWAARPQAQSRSPGHTKPRAELGNRLPGKREKRASGLPMPPAGAAPILSRLPAPIPEPAGGRHPAGGR